MGRLIPAGTGLDSYAELQIPPDAPPIEAAPEDVLEAEVEIDTDRFAEMIRAAAAAATSSEPGSTPA